MSETVIECIIYSGQKIRSRILLFRVGSVICWFRKVRLVKLKREPAVGQLGLRLNQFISGKLKSPSIIIVSRGRKVTRHIYAFSIIFLQCHLQSGTVNKDNNKSRVLESHNQ